MVNTKALIKPRLSHVLIFFVFASIVAGMFWPLTQDEGIFLTIGKMMSHGALPYISIFDHKTPGIYFVITLLEKLGINHVIFYRFFILLINCLTAYIIYLISKLIWPKSPAIWVATFYLVTLLFFEGNLILAEQFVGLFLVLSVLFTIRAQMENSRMALFAGIFAAISVIFKQTALLGLLIIGIYLLFDDKGKYKKNILFYFILGIFLTTAVFIAWLDDNHLFQPFWQQAIISNKNYGTIFTNSLALKLLAGFIATGPIWLLSVSWIHKFIKQKLKYSSELLIICLIIINLPLLFFRPYLHYWLEILPFVALGAGHYYSYLLKDKKYFSVILTQIYLISSCVIFLWLSYFVKWPILKEQFEATKYVKNITTSNDKIYTSRFFSWIYFTADRMPASKYLYINETNESLGASKTVIDDLANSKPKYVLWFSDTKNLHDPYTKEVTQYIRQNDVQIKYYNNLDLQLLKKND